MRSQADPTCVNFHWTTHNVAQSCVWASTFLYSLPTSPGHTPDERMHGLLGDLLQDLDDQSISLFLGQSVCTDVDVTIHDVPEVLD